MMKFLLLMPLLSFLICPVSALEIEAPEAPRAALELMPHKVDSFADGLSEIAQNAVKLIRPDLMEAAQLCMGIVCAAIIVSIVDTVSEGTHYVTSLIGSISISILLLQNVNAMIQLASDTIQELCDYGKLLYPVMTAAMAAQGGVTSSTSLYAATALFDAILGGLISQFLVPMVYLFLALAVANSALGDNILKKMGDLIKNTLSWCLKTLLTIFTTYMSITGVISGTTDAAALKAAKVTISSVVPVIGGILSDSSEAILLSARIMKNAAGVYGILVVLAIFLEPFIRIGTHYLMLKGTAAVCSIWGNKEIVGVIEDFSSAMGLLLGMTGAMCLLILISTVCFMKGVG